MSQAAAAAAAAVSFPSRPSLFPPTPPLLAFRLGIVALGAGGGEGRALAASSPPQLPFPTT